MPTRAGAGPETAVAAAAVPPLFAGLLDDAAIFPPRSAGMDEALRAHATTMHGPAAGFVASFTCPGGRLAELRRALPDDVSGLRLSLVVPDGLPALQSAVTAAAADPRLLLRSVELPAAGTGGARTAGAGAARTAAVSAARTAAALAACLPRGVSGYVELPLGDDLEAAAAAVAAAGCRVKIRTGGAAATAFPTAPALAAGLAVCIAAGVPVKLTAGLHHAVRHRDPSTGFEHHGFLNVICCVATALQPAPASRLAELLELRDGPALARTVLALDAAEVARVRAAFAGVGTCSTEDPVADLAALGLAGPPA